MTLRLPFGKVLAIDRKSKNSSICTGPVVGNVFVCVVYKKMQNLQMYKERNQI